MKFNFYLDMQIDFLKTKAEFPNFFIVLGWNFASVTLSLSIYYAYVRTMHNWELGAKFQIHFQMSTCSNFRLVGCG